MHTGERFKSTDDYNDMEGTLTFPNHQEFLKKTSGAQSYDLERDRCRSPEVLRQRLFRELSVADPTATKTHTHVSLGSRDWSPPLRISIISLKRGILKKFRLRAANDFRRSPDLNRRFRFRNII